MFKTRIPSPDSVEDDLESPFFPEIKKFWNDEMEDDSKQFILR